MRTVVKSTTIELQSLAGQTSFGDIAILRNKAIVSMETFRVDKLAFSPLGKPTPVDAAVNSTYLTLTQNGTDRNIEKVPFTDLIRQDNNGLSFDLDYPVIDWINSFIFTTNPAAIDNTKWFVIRIQYEDKSYVAV